jgi:hypothetical protein
MIPEQSASLTLSYQSLRPVVLTTLASNLLYLLSYVAVYADDAYEPAFILRICLLTIATLVVTVQAVLIPCSKARGGLSVLARWSTLAVNLLVYLVIDSRFLDSFLEVSDNKFPTYVGVIIISTAAHLLVPWWLQLVSNSLYLAIYLVIHATNSFDPATELIEIALVEVYFVISAFKTSSQEYSDQQIMHIEHPDDTEEDAPSQYSIFKEIRLKLTSAIASLRRSKRSPGEGFLPLRSTVNALIEAKDQLRSVASIYTLIPRNSNIDETSEVPHIPGEITKRIQRPQSIPKLEFYMDYEFEELISVLNQLGKSWNIDMFFITRLTADKPLQVCGKFFLTKYRLHEIFDVPEATYSNFFEALEQLYKPLPYHNSCHAADVLSSTVFLVNQSELREATTDLELFALIVAALAHDVGHPGVNNRYLVNSRDEMAFACEV